MGQEDFEKANNMILEGSKCLVNNDFEEALKHFSNALLFIPEADLVTKARLYNNIGHVSVRLCNPENAISAYRNAATQFEILENNIEYGYQLGNIGSVNRDIEEWSEALEYYFKSLEVFIKANHKIGIADQYSNIAFVYSNQSDLEKAYEYFNKAKTLYDEIGEEEKSQLCKNNLHALNLSLGKE